MARIFTIATKSTMEISIPSSSSHARRRPRGNPITVQSLAKHDKIIIAMKQQRCPDKEIADYLREHGYVEYAAKTIGTRWSRLRQKLGAHHHEQSLTQPCVWDRETVSTPNLVQKSRADINNLVEPRPEQQILDASQELKKMQLPEVLTMSRRELEAEMAARGFQSLGNIHELRYSVIRARMGITSLLRSGTPPDIAKFKKALAEKEVWEYDADATDDEEPPSPKEQDMNSGAT